MTQLPLLVTRRMPPEVEARASRDYRARLNPDDRLYSGDQIAALAAEISAAALLVCAGDRIDAALIERLPRSVKVIATFSVGHEHIDLPACRALGIVAANTPDVLNEATADIALLCLLGAARRAAEAERLVRDGRWNGWHTTMLLGVDLNGKRLGIFGLGRIGQAVARRARGFGLTIHYHNRRRLPLDQELGAQYHETPESLMRACDFLSIHAPSSAATRGFLNAARLALLPDGAVVVNTARGDMVDDEALIAALRSGRVRAAGLDVFAGEPNINPAYRDLPNTFLLPHMGSATIETRNAMGFAALDNIDAVLAGRPAPNALR